MARSGNCYTNSGGKRKKVTVLIISLAACLLCGCTMHTEFAPDGKTPKSITKVGIGHNVNLPSGAKVESSPVAIEAMRVAVVTLGTAAMNILGTKVTDKAIEEFSKAPVVEEKVNPGGP